MTDVSQGFVFPPRMAGLARLVLTPCVDALNVALGGADAREAGRRRRRNLLKIDDRMLADMGVNRADVDEELRATRRPAPSPASSRRRPPAEGDLARTPHPGPRSQEL